MFYPSKKIPLLLSVSCLVLTAAASFIQIQKPGEGKDLYVLYTADPKNIAFYWKDSQHQNFGSIANLKTWLYNNNQTLLFAMNGGMYKPDRSPQGLFIERGKKVAPLDTGSGNGNFYLKPNGVFFITSRDAAFISTTAGFRETKNIRFATQSGPMLLVNGKIHPAFSERSGNLNVRNGVGLLPDGKVLFAMSKKEVSFYEFASFFKNRGCKNALYLDGLVSRTYLPEAGWKQLDGNFGVIIGVTKFD